jgi:predicted dithiol-disulfide oxidoreductase (DUF899 family)
MTRLASREVWLARRRALLAKEKALTKLRDELAAERRMLPGVRIDKDYRFEGVAGRHGLADLFSGKSQLIVYHFMLGPDWSEPCRSCSFWAEHFDGARVHLAERDTELVAISRAPIARIIEIRERFGWRFPWVSSLGSDFNFDFGVSFTDEQDGKALYNFASQKAIKGEMPGLSVFLKDEAGTAFHTYSTYARGLDALNGTYQLLDLTPKGRDEGGLPWPMAWVRHKDRYPKGG